MAEKKIKNKEILEKEIDLVQAIINRMAHNSFLLKGWLISIVAVILALKKDSLFTQDTNFLLYAVICLPVFSFWTLDAYFLRQERMYRKLHEWLIKNRPLNLDDIYNLNAQRFSDKVASRLKTMCSTTLITFYAVPLIIILLLATYDIIGVLKCP